jgi:hypothetical protein
VVLHASPSTVEEAPPVEATDRQLVDTYEGWTPGWSSMPICTDRSAAGSAR